MTLQEQLERGFGAFERGDFFTAAEAARAAMRIAPKNPDALTLMGRLALVSGRLDVALPLFQSLAASPFRTPDVLVDLARALLTLRREDEAVATVKQAVALAPNYVEALLLLAGLHHSNDDRDEAAAAARRIIAIEPAYTAAYLILARTGAITPDSNETKAMADLLSQSGDAQCAELHYALSTLHKRAGENDKFIAHMLAANAAQKRVFQGHRLEYARMFDRIERCLDALESAQSTECAGPIPIFIVGMPRSGTSLVEQIIGGATDVKMGGELLYTNTIFAPAIEQMTGAPFPKRFETLSKAQVNAATAPWAQLHVMIAAGKRFLTEKTPDNFLNLGVLTKCFPECRVIHIQRNVMDTCFSILQQPFDSRAAHLYDIDLLAYYYARYEKLMAAWRERLGDRLLTVRYESLVQDPDGEARRIMAHCGLDWTDDLLAFHARKRAVHTFSADQVRRPLNADSVGAWRRFSAELAPLQAALTAEGVNPG